MNKLETAAQRDEKVRDLAKKIGRHCAEYYGRLSEPQRELLLKKLDTLDYALNAYRNYERPWDSQLIRVAYKIGGVRVQGRAFSTFESVMDHARDVFAHLVLPDE